MDRPVVSRKAKAETRRCRLIQPRSFSDGQENQTEAAHEAAAGVLMPVLPNARHEAFAKALAQGKTADDAYEIAGFRQNRGNATRLKANESIRARVAELAEKAAEKALKAISFEAADMFRDLLNDIKLAHEANDHKTALDGRKFLLRCFGYEDSPTLTHEHVKGDKLNAPDRQHAPEEDRQELRDSVVKNFAEELKKLRKRAS